MLAERGEELDAGSWDKEGDLGGDGVSGVFGEVVKIAWERELPNDGGEE